MGLLQWLSVLPLRLRSLLRRRTVERELDEELRYHLDSQIAQNLRHGMTADGARTAALRALGGLERRREECRDTRGTRMIENLWRDAAYAVRTLRRTPAYTAATLVTLALGLGANAAIFSVVNAVLLQPLPYRDPGRLVVVDGTVAPANFIDWRAAARAFDRMGVAEWWEPTLSGGDTPTRIQALRLSGDILPMLGVRPLFGRLPQPAEEQAGGARVVVLGYAAWRTHFAADPAILGRGIVLDGEPYSVIGVMPPGFQFAPYWATGAQLWAPLMLEPRANDRTGQSLRLFARLAPGVTLRQARAELAAITNRLEQAYPGTNRGVKVVPLREMVVGDVRPALLILLGAVALVLMIACANVAHLQLMRATSREREFAMRVALGAGRGRLVQQTLVESALLATAGAVLGWAVALGGVHVLVATAPASIPRLDAIHLDGWTFAFLACIALFSGAVSGLAPALRASRVQAAEALKQGGRGSTSAPGRRRIRAALVVSEFAMAIVLLVCAGLLLRTFLSLVHLDPGFDPNGILTFTVTLQGTVDAVPGRRDPFFQDLETRLRGLPGVRAAGAINHLPINGDNWRFPFTPEGRPAARPGERPKALFRVIRPGYFEAMHIPLVRGRGISTADLTGHAHIVVINETMARRYWPGEDAVGRRLSVDDPQTDPDWFTVVGVVRDVTQAHLRGPIDPEMYFPYLEGPARGDDARTLVHFLNPVSLTFVLRAAGDPAALAHPAARLVHEIDPNAALSSVATMVSVLSQEFTEPTFYLLLIGGFAALAVTLAGVGVYAVIGYAAVQRTHEMGVRLAMGAGVREPFRLLTMEGMRLAMEGSAIGLATAFFLTRYLRTLLYGVRPSDPAMYGLAALVLALVALIACWVPAGRAARLDPLEALRCE